MEFPAAKQGRGYLKSYISIWNYRSIRIISVRGLAIKADFQEEERTWPVFTKKFCVHKGEKRKPRAAKGLINGWRSGPTTMGQGRLCQT